MNIRWYLGRKAHEKIELQMSEDEARTVYFALLEYARTCVKQVGDPEYVKDHVAEEYAFLGDIISRCGVALQTFEESYAHDHLGATVTIARLLDVQ